MSRFPAYIAALIVLIIGVVAWAFYFQTNGCSTDVPSHYLLVEVIGPPEWRKDRHFSVLSGGTATELPIAFHRSNRNTDYPAVGPMNSIEFGEDTHLITVDPSTPIEIRLVARSIFAVFDAKSKTMSRIAVVTVTPPQHPLDKREGERWDEDYCKSEVRWIEKLKELLANGQVIEMRSRP